MSLNRISMRASAILALLAMAILALAVALVSGRIYRDHALENERAALYERLRMGIDVMHGRLNREAQGAVRQFIESPPENRASARKSD